MAQQRTDWRSGPIENVCKALVISSLSFVSGQEIFTVEGFKPESY